jgi:hypothetical protein
MAKCQLSKDLRKSLLHEDNRDICIKIYKEVFRHCLEDIKNIVVSYPTTDNWLRKKCSYCDAWNYIPCKVPSNMVVTDVAMHYYSFRYDSLERCNLCNKVGVFVPKCYNCEDELLPRTDTLCYGHLFINDELEEEFSIKIEEYERLLEKEYYDKGLYV